MPRPSLIHDPQLAQEIAYKIAIGVKQQDIANALNIPPDTLTKWKRRKDFSRLIAKNRVALQTSLISKNTDSDNPKDAQWVLERLYRDEWSPPKAVNDQAQVGNVTINLIVPPGARIGKDQVEQWADRLSIEHQPEEGK